MPAHKSGKKGRKINRTARSPAGKAYVAEHRWVKNKIRKVTRHLKTHPADLQAEERLTSNFKEIKIKYKKS